MSLKCLQIYVPLSRQVSLESKTGRSAVLHKHDEPMTHGQQLIEALLKREVELEDVT